MRCLLNLFFFLIAFPGFSQDTTIMAVYSGEGKMLLVDNGIDTVIVSIYPEGTKEYEKDLRNGEIHGKYIRWYPNGELMWEQKYSKGEKHGEAVYWSNEGEKVAELYYANDSITDTLFFSEKYALILGHGTSSSIVYGGMERVGDNLPKQPSKGPMINKAFYVVKIEDENEIPEIYLTFNSDQKGDFILCLPKGNYGVFPESFSAEDLKPGQVSPPGNQRGPSWSSFWRPDKPLLIEKPEVRRLYLNSRFVGYAP